MNKSGQLDYPIIAFFVIVIGILIAGPMLMKMMSSIQTPMSNALGNLSTDKGGDIAQANFNSVMTTSQNMMDKTLIFVFVIAVIILIVSAFLIDTSPFWMILYIFISMMLIILSPNIIDGLQHIWGSQAFATEVARLSYLNGIRTNFIFILVSLMVITGIIIYGKLSRGFRSGGRV